MENTLITSEPIIGVSCSGVMSPSLQAMVNQLNRLSAWHIVLDDHKLYNAERDIERINALIVMGNDFDIDPFSYIARYDKNDQKRCVHPKTKSERECPLARARGEYENLILKEALNRNIPILAICGGMHRLNVLCGGTLHQHIPDLTGNDSHEQRHSHVPLDKAVVPLILLENTMLADIAYNLDMPFIKTSCKNTTKVVEENSMHHQAIDQLGNGLVASALCDAFPQADGTMDYMVKAIEADPKGPYKNHSILGVQWHPEFGASCLGDNILRYITQCALHHKNTWDAFQPAHIGQNSTANDHTPNREFPASFA